MTESEEPPGNVVGGRYELGERLGRGGMAVVFRATDTRLDRPVAVKQLRQDLASDPTFQTRFRREAQSAAGLSHPNIVAVYDTGEEYDPVAEAQVPYIVMELVEGTTLRDVLRSQHRILPERALELTSGVLDALTFSHQAGIVHRDIKPANVMLTPSGGIKVMDFGIARAVADTSATMTQTASVIGTAQYLSPEQARGETVDARSDLYSAGCVLYELLVGRPPFTGDSPVSVAYQHVRETPTPVNELDPSISPEINAIVMKVLAKDPGQRYQSARDMKADIGRVLAGEQATAAITPTPGYPAPTGSPAAATGGGPANGASTGATGAAAAAAGPEAGKPDSGPDEEKQNRTGLVIGILAVIVVLLAAGGAGGWWYLRGHNSAASTVRVTVPKVTGMDRDRAASDLKSRGLVAKFSQIHGSDDQTVNTTTKQNPAANTRVEKGSTVNVTVNIGPKHGTVPTDLVGKSYEHAKSALVDAGFHSKNIKRRDASRPEPKDAKKNEVLATDPKEGAQVGLNHQVTLTVATGKSKVPDLHGAQRSAAKRRASKAGFKTRVKKSSDSAEPAGTVVEQSPQPGKLIMRGKTITITVAEKQGPSPKPTVTKTRTQSAPPSATGSPPSASESPSASSSPSKSPTESESGSPSPSKSPSSSNSPSESPSSSNSASESPSSSNSASESPSSSNSASKSPSPSNSSSESPSESASESATSSASASESATSSASASESATSSTSPSKSSSSKPSKTASKSPPET
jgi:serine/threonine-protein kinase